MYIRLEIVNISLSCNANSFTAHLNHDQNYNIYEIKKSTSGTSPLQPIHSHFRQNKNTLSPEQGEQTRTFEELTEGTRPHQEVESRLLCKCRHWLNPSCTGNTTEEFQETHQHQHPGCVMTIQLFPIFHKGQPDDSIFFTSQML